MLAFLFDELSLLHSFFNLGFLHFNLLLFGFHGLGLSVDFISNDLGLVLNLDELSLADLHVLAHLLHHTRTLHQFGNSLGKHLDLLFHRDFGHF